MTLETWLLAVVAVVVWGVVVLTLRRRQAARDQIRREQDTLRRVAATAYASQADRRGEGSPRNGGRD